MRMKMMIPKMRKGLVGWAVTAPGGPSNFLESTQEPPEQASQSLITLGSASFRGGGGRSTPFHSFCLVGLLVGHTSTCYREEVFAHLYFSVPPAFVFLLLVNLVFLFRDRSRLHGWFKAGTIIQKGSRTFSEIQGDFFHWYPPKMYGSMENLGKVNLRWRRSA